MVPAGAVLGSTKLDRDSCEPTEESLFELANTIGTGTVVQEFTVEVTGDDTKCEFMLAYFGSPINECEGISMAVDELIIDAFLVILGSDVCFVECIICDECGIAAAYNEGLVDKTLLL